MSISLHGMSPRTASHLTWNKGSRSWPSENFPPLSLEPASSEFPQEPSANARPRGFSLCCIHDLFLARRVHACPFLPQLPTVPDHKQYRPTRPAFRSPSLLRHASWGKPSLKWGGPRPCNLPVVTLLRRWLLRHCGNHHLSSISQN